MAWGRVGREDWCLESREIVFVRLMIGIGVVVVFRCMVLLGL